MLHRGNPHIPLLSTFPMHRHKPLTSCRAWEARRDPLFPLCHLVGAALEAAGVSGHGVWFAAALGGFMDAAPRSIRGLLWMQHSWEMLPSPLFPAACFFPGWEHHKPSWFRDNLQQEQSPGSWVRVSLVLPVTWGVNWNDSGMCPALHP